MGTGVQSDSNAHEEIEILNETLTLLQSDLKEEKDKNEFLTKEVESNK